MKETFIDKNFRPETLGLIRAAIGIVKEYQAQGYALTLRQLYYQFVARDLLANTERNYKRLGSVINDARLAGYIDWDAIEDRTRGSERNLHLSGPKNAIEIVRAQYGIDMWANQPTRVEVWIEKEALVGVIEPVCRELDTPYLACRGYVSQSEQWRAYRRIAANAENHDQSTIVLHFGDHDPSGVDMTRDNSDRLEMFLQSRGLGSMCTVKRLALNMDQIEKYSPPPNPAKSTDSRFDGYRREFGDESWELDALEPAVITKLIRQETLSIRDEDKWAEKEQQLADEIARLDQIIVDLEEEA